MTVGRDRLVLADVRPGRGGAVVRHRVELAFEVGRGLDQPDKLGAALAELMKREGIKPGRVALGLSTRWVLASPRTLPPVADAALVGAVRLQIERDYAGGRDELVFDYTEPTPLPVPGANGSRQLVLVGTQRKRLQQATAAATAAGLTVTHAMPTGLALAEGACAPGSTPGSPTPDDTNTLVIALENDGAAFVHLKQGRCYGLSSCAFDPASITATEDSTADWARAIQRNAAAAVAEGATVRVIDAASLTDEQRTAAEGALSELLGPVTLTRLDPAAAAAQATFRDPATINFTRPRLAVKGRRKLPPAAAWAIRAAVLVLLVGGTVGYLWYDAASDLKELEENYAAIADQAEQLQQLREDTRAVAGWYDQRPPVMDCLLELTQTFPKQGRIWVTSLSLDADASGTLSCKAQDEATMFAYLNAMKQSPNLVDVQLQGSRDTDREGTTVSFEVIFKYVPGNRGTLAGDGGASTSAAASTPPGGEG